MVAQRRSSIAFGLILVLLGAWFLVVQWVPGLEAWLGLKAGWPLFIVGFGLVFLIFGIITGTPGLAVPAAVFMGIGGLLYWQNATGNWQSWAYAWALIPGFAGVGTILMGLMGQDTRQSLTGGAWLIVISLVLFAVFGSLLGGLSLFGAYWPALLILLGVVLLIQSVFRFR